MNNGTDTPAYQTHQKRPTGLTILCVLSFVGSGISLFSHLMVWLFYNTFLDLLASDIYSSIPNLNIEELESYLKAGGQLFFLISAVLFLFSLVGVYKMWHLKKIGIHYYAIAQFLLIVIPLLFISTNMPVFGALLISLLFVLMYARYLKIMY